MQTSANQQLGWGQLVYRVRKSTTLRNDEQHPYAFTLPGPRIGLRASVRDGILKVENVSSPATELGINAGDVILSVDGRKMQKEDDFYDAVFESNRNSFQFEVRDRNGGKVRSITLKKR